MEPHTSKRRKLNYLPMVQSNHLLSGDPLSARLPTHHQPILPQNTLALLKDNGSIPSKKSLSAQDHQAMSASDSSIFQMQIQELLAKVRPSHGSRMEKVEVALRQLKRVIELIPNREPTTVILFSACISEVLPAKCASIGFASRARPTRIPQYHNSILRAKARSRGNMCIDIC